MCFDKLCLNNDDNLFLVCGLFILMYFAKLLFIVTNYVMRKTEKISNFKETFAILC